MNQPGGPDPVYVRARRALLDALDALGRQRDAVILVGAQAVYLHVAGSGSVLAGYTKDADLALNPVLLADLLTLQQLLADAGFTRREQPGLWFSSDGAEVDLLVPASIAGKGRRGVELGAGHERTAAMRVAGLEAALIDCALHRIAALDSTDQRAFTIAVAGPAALLVAKLYKIGERSQGMPDRLNNKDASDLFLPLLGREMSVVTKEVHKFFVCRHLVSSRRDTVKVREEFVVAVVDRASTGCQISVRLTLTRLPRGRPKPHLFRVNLAQDRLSAIICQ